MVAVTKSKDYEEIKNNLKTGESIAIFSCNTCTRSMSPATGGPEAVHELKKKLIADGFKVLDQIYLTAACFEDYIEDAKTIITDKWTTGIVLACESGYGVVKTHLPKRRIIRGLDTQGILMKDGKSHFKPVITLDI